MPFLSLLRGSFSPVSQVLSTNIRSFCIIKSSTLILPRQAVFRKGTELVSHHVRKYSVKQNAQNVDPNQQKRRKGLMVLTYMSGFVGACLLTVVGARQYQRLKQRARGIEPIKNRLYGRKAIIFRYRGFVMPDFVMNVMDQVHPFKVREDDIFIMSFPKSGTSWLQEIVYLISNDVDFECVKSNLEDRMPYFEYFYPGIPEIEKMSSPRIMKTHLPFALLPNDFKDKKPKTFYIARNPKDTAVSLHYMLQKFLAPMIEYRISFDDFCQLFIDDEVMYGPWWKHVKEGWERRNDDHVLFLTYEDMKTDLPGSITKIAAHLGKTLTPQELDAIVSHATFDKMKDNKFVNFDWFKDRGQADPKEHFMRKGTVGDWKNHWSKEKAIKMDEVTATKIEPLGLALRDTLDEEGART